MAVQLDEESRLLTTFNNPFGRYCYKHMPFGLNLSQNEFQERMDHILENCPGTISIADDIGVFGSSEGEHDENLHNLMRVAQAHGLSDAETRYANIEREMLAVVFGCERFHTYVFGKSVTIESDHRPLEMIHLKNLSAAPQRLQRMLLRIQPYAITIRYRPGKEMAMADALSRQPCDNKEQIQLYVQLHFVQSSTQRLDILRDETRQDAELMELQTIIHDGWPEKRKEVPAEIRKYCAFRDEMAVADGLVTKGDCVIIPKTLRRDILEKLHAAHQGIENTRLRARTCVYWSGINGDIEEMFSKCGICQEMQHAQRPEPLLQHEVPTRP